MYIPIAPSPLTPCGPDAAHPALGISLVLGRRLHQAVVLPELEDVGETHHVKVVVGSQLRQDRLEKCNTII